LRAEAEAITIVEEL